MMKKIVLLLITVLSITGCKDSTQLLWTLEPDKLRDNIWAEEATSNWTPYTTVASNNQLAYYVGNQIHVHTVDGMIKIGDYPTQNVKDKFAIVSTTGDLITGGGQAENGTIQRRFYRYTRLGVLAFSGVVPQTDTISREAPKVFGYNGDLFTEGKEVDSTGRVAHFIFRWDENFNFKERMPAGRMADLKQAFQRDGKFYFLFSNGLMRLEDNKLVEDPEMYITIVTVFEQSVPQFAFTNSKFVMGWPARIRNNSYAPYDKMVFYNSADPKLIGSPELCNPQIYFLNDVLVLVGGATGSIATPTYNLKLHKILLK